MDKIPTYPYVCPVCGELNEIELTPLMEHGAKDDYVSCWNCNAYLHITFNDSHDHLIATPYDIYMKEAMEKIINELLCLL